MKCKTISVNLVCFNPQDGTARKRNVLIYYTSWGGCQMLPEYASLKLET